MAFDAEAVIVSEFQKFVMDGSLYRGSKPVMWSVVEKTALAEAEVEYEEHVSPTIFVNSPLPRHPTVADAKLLCGDLDDNAVDTARQPRHGLCRKPDLWRISGRRRQAGVCDSLADQVMQAAGIETYARLQDIDPGTLTCKHPLAEQGYDFDVPLLAGDFVTDETGTGLVHIAPGHGQDDFELGMKHGLNVPFTVNEAGVITMMCRCLPARACLTTKARTGLPMAL